MYCQLLQDRPIIKEIHLGGGTPTFLGRTFGGVDSGHFSPKPRLHHSTEFSFEGHPNNTTREQLQALYDVGFRRVSYGVQDYNLNVQKAIHRIQPFEHVEQVTRWAREIGYESIS